MQKAPTSKKKKQWKESISIKGNKNKMKSNQIKTSTQEKVRQVLYCFNYIPAHPIRTIKES